MNRKTIILTILLISIVFESYGQKSPNRNRLKGTNKTINENYFKTNSPSEKNKFKPIFSNGIYYGMYGSIGNNNNIKTSSSNTISMTTRYLFSENLGLNLKFGFDQFKTKFDNLSKSNFAIASLDIVYDLGGVLDFKSIDFDMNTGKSKFQLYTHTGLGVASMWNKEFNSSNATDPYFKNHDDIICWNIGISPEFRLNRRISLNFDFSINNNYEQDRSFNYSIENKSNFAQMYSIQIGVNYFY